MKLVDISHWNKVDWTKFQEYAIIKATEGIHFVDPKYKENKKELRKRNLLIGFYHFADGYNPEKEAKHFVKNVDVKHGELVALDYEIHLSNPVSWCLRWLKAVEKELGFKPLIYLNQATLKRYNWKPVVDNDNGLWIAKYPFQ